MSEIEDAKLIGCPICGGKVSSYAKYCPHCGHPVEKPREIVKTVKDHVNEAATVIAPKAKQAANGFICLVVFVVKFALWFAIAALLGFVGIAWATEAARQGYTSCAWFIALFPAIISLPCRYAAAKIVCAGFARFYSYLFALSAVLTSPSIFGHFDKPFGLTREEIMCRVVSTCIAFAWAVFFATHKRISPEEYILKHIIIWISAIIAVLIVVGNVMQLAQ